MNPRQYEKYVNTGPAAWRGIRATEFHDTDVGALRRRLRGRRAMGRLLAAVVVSCGLLFACAAVVGN